MSEIRSPKSCALFKPGHNPHWIQMRLAAEDRQRPPVPGHLVTISNEGELVIEVEGQHARLWNHDAVRLSEAITAAHGELLFQPRWGLLHLPRDDGRFAFCVAPAEHVECRTTTPVGGLGDVLRLDGGFSVAGKDLLRDIAN
jgi:hypothetical protein